MIKMPHFIDKNCTSCGACLTFCPNHAIDAEKPTYLIDSDLCNDCTICVNHCSENAIHPIK